MNRNVVAAEHKGKTLLRKNRRKVENFAVPPPSFRTRSLRSKLEKMLINIPWTTSQSFSSSSNLFPTCQLDYEQMFSPAWTDKDVGLYSQINLNCMPFWNIVMQQSLQGFFCDHISCNSCNIVIVHLLYHSEDAIYYIASKSK